MAKSVKICLPTNPETHLLLQLSAAVVTEDQPMWQVNFTHGPDRLDMPGLY